MTGEIRDNPSRHRFELAVDGHVAFVTYRRAPSVITLVHTEVPKELAGKGVGTGIARQVLDHARAEGLKVVPLCPFIAAFIERHEEYKDLVA